MGAFFMVLCFISIICFLVGSILWIVSSVRKEKSIRKQNFTLTSLLIFVVSLISFVLTTAYEGLTFATIIIWVVGIICFMLFAKSTNTLKKRLEELDAETFLIANHVEGLPIPQSTAMNIFSCPEKLVLESKKGKYEIPNERITNYAKFTKQEIIQRDKSVIGRAVIGGVLLGGLGAIIGGMSGIGSKSRNKEHGYFVINYTDKNGEVKAISFESNLNIDHFVFKFSEVLNKSKGIENHDPTKTVTL